MRKMAHWLLGHDEFVDDEHVAHEPSLWQRLRARPGSRIAFLEITIAWYEKEAR